MVQLILACRGAWRRVKARPLITFSIQTKLINFYEHLLFFPPLLMGRWSGFIYHLCLLSGTERERERERVLWQGWAFLIFNVWDPGTLARPIGSRGIGSSSWEENAGTRHSSAVFIAWGSSTSFLGAQCLVTEANPALKYEKKNTHKHTVLFQEEVAPHDFSNYGDGWNHLLPWLQPGGRPQKASSSCRALNLQKKNLKRLVTQSDLNMSCKQTDLRFSSSPVAQFICHFPLCW